MAKNKNDKAEKKDKLQRLRPKQLHQIICRALENALNPHSDIPTVGDGFVEGITLCDIILEEQDQIIHESQRNNYTTLYNPTELITKDINSTLAKIGKTVIIKDDVKPYLYKGYKGLLNDYIYCTTFLNNKPVEKDTFNFIKGTLDFNTMAAIRNRIKDVTDTAWEDYCMLHPKMSKNKAMEKEIRNQYKPAAPFICIEGSVYEFTPEFDEKTERERELLLEFADAIIYKKVLEVTYQAPHYDHPDKLEFHPHYIRKVGNKLMVYGRSRSIAFHKPDEYTLVNLIVLRTLDVREYPIEKHYYSAQELGLDYNDELFRHRMTFNAPGYSKEVEDCTRVVLKVRKCIPTPKNPRMPFTRLLAEPLHHSQQICTDYPESEEYGYVSLFISDSQFIRPILLSWGSDIEVMEPESLRLQMQKEANRLIYMYGTLTNNEESTATATT